MRMLRKHSEEYKLAVVREIERRGSVTEVERATGIHRSLLYRWYKKLSRTAVGASGDAASVGKKQGYQAVKRWKRFSDEFKMAAVREVEGGKSVPEVARMLELDKATVYNWFKQFSGQEAIKRESPSVEELQMKIEAEQRQQEQEAEKMREAEEAATKRVKAMVADPLVWMQRHTQTRDSHWRESGALSPYRPFPKKPYFPPLVEAFQTEPVLFVEKSRDMMLSWLFVGLFTHAAMTMPGIEVLLQSQKEDKAFELVNYAKTLYERQDEEIQRAFPLAKNIRQMADGELEFAHGSRILGIPGGGDQIRSYHPWGLLMDEAAFMPEAGKAYDHAVPVCQKIVVVSSAGPGWFADFVRS